MTTYLASFFGFIFIELLAIGRRKPRTPFSLGVYWSNNWELVMANACASIGLMLGIKEILAIEVEYLGSSYEVMTGLIIGMLGSLILRYLIGKAKERLPKGAHFEE